MLKISTANKLVEQLFEEPTNVVTTEHVKAVYLWAEHLIAYVKSIDETTPARVSMQIKRNFQMQVKVAGLLVLTMDIYTPKCSLSLKHSGDDRKVAYDHILRTTEVCLQHLQSLPVKLGH